MDVRTIGFLLKDVTRLYSRRVEERAQDLSLAQCKALSYLARNEGVSQKRLAELTELDPMSLVRILDRMEADGWVERRADPQDRRARTLWLLPQAAPVLERIDTISRQTRAEALAGFTESERWQLSNLLERVHDNLSSVKPLAAGESSAPEPAGGRARQLRAGK